jgi:UDP-N-acetylglucosamine 2-epimerase (non-hydrolysing)
MKKTILFVFGTRPEAIKMAPLIRQLNKNSKYFVTKVCVTAQHREMLDQVLDFFEIIPDFDLDIMKAGQDLYDVTSKVLVGMRNVLQNLKPDLVLVHGDTSTSTAAALAAYYMQIPVGHIEAGLRTNDIYNPWPEELNRQLTSRIAAIHFAPTKLSRANLIHEGINSMRISVVGNTVIDSLFFTLDKINRIKNLEYTLKTKISSLGIPLDNIEQWIHNNNRSFPPPKNTPARRMILITGHRRENFGTGFINICNAIKVLAAKYPSIDFVYPMHLNPNVRKAIEIVFKIDLESNSGFDKAPKNIFFVEPLEYLPFVYLMNLSYLILTDSGGIQEEGPALGKPILVMRNKTERPEAVNAGTVKLVGVSKSRIVKEVSILISDPKEYNKMGRAKNPFGYGDASEKIVDRLLKYKW